MKKVFILACMVALSGSAYCETQTHWKYSGDKGPEHWAQLHPDFLACDGKNQSPINLLGFIQSELTPLSFSYSAGGYEVLNNGHTVQVNFKKGSHLKIDDTQFDLLQFHFHSPSENLVKSRSYPLEAHFVHSDKEGNLAVVAVLFEAGAPNASLAKIWATMPERLGDKHALPESFDADNLFPKNRDYYRYNGSLTTPPCTEGVRWFVMKETLTISKNQIKQFTDVLHEPNNRPTQPLNARSILK